MSLPKIYAPMETVEIGGEQFTLRVLTRAEHFKFQKMAEKDAPGDEMEIEVIALATDTPVAAVREWYAATPDWAVKELVDHITRISRLDGEAQKSGG